MTGKWKSTLIRGAKGLAAVAVGFLASWVVSPDVLDILGSNAWIVTVVVTPALLAAEKYLKYTP